MAYTNLTNVENLLKRELTDAESSVLPLIIDVVEKYINEQVGGSFGVVEETSRLYDGTGDKIIDIDPCTDISAVEVVDIDGDATKTYVVDDLVLRPVNDTVKRWIELPYFGFYRGSANIRVTAKFSLGDVPSDIEYLATYLVTKYFNDYVTGNIKSESIEGYSRTFESLSRGDFIVSSVLDKYTSDSVYF